MKNRWEVDNWKEYDRWTHAADGGSTDDEGDGDGTEYTIR